MVASVPPSRLIAVPATKVAQSETRKAARSANSSASLIPPSGIRAARLVERLSRRRLPVRRSHGALLISPMHGQIGLTRWKCDEVHLFFTPTSHHRPRFSGPCDRGNPCRRNRLPGGQTPRIPWTRKPSYHDLVYKSSTPHGLVDRKSSPPGAQPKPLNQPDLTSPLPLP